MIISGMVILFSINNRRYSEHHAVCASLFCLDFSSNFLESTATLMIFLLFPEHLASLALWKFLVFNLISQFQTFYFTLCLWFGQGLLFLFVFDSSQRCLQNEMSNISVRNIYFVNLSSISNEVWYR